MKYAVCAGKTLNHGVAKTVGKETTVEVQTFNAGDLTTIKDEKEIDRLLTAGVIRALDEIPTEDDGES